MSACTGYWCASWTSCTVSTQGGNPIPFLLPFRTAGRRCRTDSSVGRSFPFRTGPPGKWLVFDAVLGSPVAAGMEGHEAADRERSLLNKREWQSPSKAD